MTAPIGQRTPFFKTNAGADQSVSHPVVSSCSAFDVCAPRPAFGVGTGGTQPFHHDDAVPTPDALPEGDVHSLAQPLGGNEGGSGWKVVSGQIEVGVQCTETSTLGDPDAVTVASRRKELEELAQALTETRKELEDAREVEKALR